MQRVVVVSVMCWSETDVVASFPLPVYLLKVAVVAAHMSYYSMLFSLETDVCPSFSSFLLHGLEIKSNIKTKCFNGRQKITFFIFFFNV
jgi:hypothetical protein